MNYVKYLVTAAVLVLASCSSSVSTEEYLDRGTAYMDKKEWKSAIIEFKNGIKQSPKNAQARFLLGEAYIKTFSGDAAIKEFNKSIELGLDKNKVIARIGQAYAQTNRNDEILNEVRLNDELSKEDSLVVLSLRAGAYLRKNDAKSAFAELSKAKEIDSNHHEVRLMWAQYEAQYGSVEKRLEWLEPLVALSVPDALSQMADIEKLKPDLTKADELYTQAIDARGKIIHQDYLSRALVRLSLNNFKGAKRDLWMLRKAGLVSPVVLHSEGVIAFYEKDYELAETRFNKVLSRYKEYPPSLFMLGLIQYQKDNFRSAIKNLTEYLGFFPDNDQARFVLANSYLKSNEYAAAINELLILNEKDKNDSKVSSLLGIAYVKSGQLSDGVTIFKKLAEQSPEQASTQLQLGAALIRDKKTIKDGQAALLKALDLDPSLDEANLPLYLSYMQSKEFDQAIALAKKIMMDKPDDSLAYNLHAHAILQTGDKEKAESLFEEALNKFPFDPIISNNLARVKLQRNALEEAKSIYLNVLEKHPSDLRTLVSLAVVESKLGNQEQKMKHLEAAVETNSSVLSPKLILATEYLKAEKFRESLRVLRELSDEDNKRIEVQLINAKAKMGLKDYEYALVILKKLVAQNPDSASARFLLALNYGHLKQTTNMKSALVQVLDIKPDHFSAGLTLARMALIDGNKEEFQVYIKRMMALYPDHADVKFLHAKLNNSDQDFKTAIITLEDLLKDNSHPEIVVDLSRNKWAAGDKDGAIAGLEIWTESNPDNKKVLMLLGQFYLSMNRFDEAKNVYDKVGKLVPNNAIVLNNLAWLYRESDVVEGIRLARKALALEPENPFIKDTLAMLLLGNNNIEEALTYASEAATAQPNFVEIQVNYAKVLIAGQDKTTAKNILSAIYTKAKSFDQRQEIQTMLNSL